MRATPVSMEVCEGSVLLGLIVFAANVWLTGFTHSDVAKMVKVSATPFVSGGQVLR